MATNPAPVPPQWPPKIILATQGLMATFEAELYPLQLEGSDFTEIVRQIIDLLLNFGSKAKESYPLLPDMSRLVTKCIQNDPRAQETLMRAAQQLAYALQAQVEHIGGIRQHGNMGEEFPYYLTGFHGHDAVLEYLPY